MLLNAFPSLSRRLSRFGTPLVSFALLLLLAALLAHWTWRFVAPAPRQALTTMRADMVPGAELALLRAAYLFGSAPGQEVQTERVTSLNLKLHGVFAALGEMPAMAILGVDGKDQAVSGGQEFVPGVVLDTVHPDHVILLNQGVRERLDLDAVGRPLTLADGDIPVSRQEFSLALANPQNLGVQARAGSGARGGLELTSVDGNGLAARLGRCRAATCCEWSTAVRLPMFRILRGNCPVPLGCSV